MRFLQKLEKIFESAPQFITQTYVVLNQDVIDDDGENSNNTTTPTFWVQILSIFLSVYAISDKVINDDTKSFILQSGANTSWLPHWRWITRCAYVFSCLRSLRHV